MVFIALPHLVRIFRLLLLVVVLLVIATQTIIPISVNAYPNNVVWSSSRIGAVEAHFRPHDADEANIGWERIVFEWRFFQPNGPDDWDESSIDPAWLDSAYGSGRMVVGLIKNAPHWATGSDLLGAPAQ